MQYSLHAIDKCKMQFKEQILLKAKRTLKISCHFLYEFDESRLKFVLWDCGVFKLDVLLHISLESQSCLVEIISLLPHQICRIEFH